MTTILHDKAKCKNGQECPRRMDCIRWITPSCGPEQIEASFFVSGEECEAYWATQEQKSN